MKTEPIIQVNKLGFRYSQEQPDWSLEDVSLEVYKGEWLAIIGHNGSGKSTLAKCLNGLLVPEKGDILVNGLNTKEGETLWEIRRLVGMVFQNPDNQFVGATVRDDVAFGMENHGIPREEMVIRLQEALDWVGMSDYVEQEPHRLSGGQKQRVAIAGIIALRPSIIVLDEATSMLDPKGQADIIEIMRRLNKEQGITVLSITHDLEEASHADRIVVMNQGHVLGEGTPREVFKDPEQLLSIGLDLPFSVKLREGLTNQQVRVSKEIFLEEELVEELWTLRSRH
ncbi:energy-coupling factor ABC transporter ATP-binding protein [Pullulanibacillus sp. KACC 23026]|uniref:energy-coupling factor ABC transporter ATP-binding protein n=1 Tax=Pullulanibacillus sp. KACC 23026 TaxID=3028315 RepID=UPI0023AF97D1|nr:energy-coupling factor ABC transporter ATP-binding protein [Pullulanibacillus sp. KACC 23026]WEG12644.1 energy-coupling factor ABC transporter ATP-binding protein [Pullulanibacillus sp. KACC 23026]